MNHIMNSETLRHIFKAPFDYKTYCNEIVHRLFGCNDVASRPELLDTNDEGDQSYFIGQMDDTDGRLLGFFYTQVAEGSDVRRKRVGLRKLISPYLKYDVDGAIAVFDDGRHWRLSYICDLKEGSTSAKRFSYIMGDENGQYKTPLERLEKIARLNGRIKLSDLKESFSVDALSDEFFDEYHDHYDRIVAELERQRKTGALYHDYVKKLMGRIVFLYFLQKKGWLCRDTNFMYNTFLGSNRQNDYLESVLEPLFFGILNTEPAKREQVFSRNGWQQSLVEKMASIPYLNGGLFERDDVDELKIVLPEIRFRELFAFLASYNFTVDENDPDDAEIGVDPEMLGKIFESLLEDNKAKGAFYTPKEIVRYMCKESLIAHLASKLPDVSDAVIRTFVETHEMQPELEPYRDTLSTALREVKICDPAIGSGAFPMGLLNELWRCREALGTQESRLQLKKEIIENNIYGVDIERGAIDIARLRFWLSIVVDSDEPQPLPNFDYKFMQGNSLIESYGGYDLSRIAGKTVGRPSTSTQYVIGLDSDLSQKNLQRLLREYFSVTDHQKKATMRHAINAEVKTLIRESVGGTPTFLSKLSALDPSANQEFFLWHTWFKDIFDGGGFDIVIGNPPYVVLAGDDYWNLEYKKLYDTANDGKTNLYKLFYELGLRILIPNGVLSFITPNTYLAGKDSKVLREKMFTQTSLKEIIEYTEKDKVFENVTQAVTTLVLKKVYNKDNIVKIRTYKQGVALSKQSDLQKIGLILPLNSVIQKMNKQKGSLTDSFQINQGEVNLSTKSEYYSTVQFSDALPMWRGNNVGKYYPQSFPIEWCSKWVSKVEYYSKKRIVMQEVSNQNQPFRTKAFISPQNYICGHSTNSLTPKQDSVNLKLFLALINSRAFNYYCDYFSFTNHITVSGIKQVPIPIVPKELQEMLVQIVDQILDKKKANPCVDTSIMEREIDKMVYELYDLGPEEISAIEDV